MSNLLSALGYTVTTFDSAASFLSQDEASRTDCLIADVHMPHMSGLDLMEHLDRIGRHIPTIFVTAHPQDVLRQKALSRGAVDYLGKPVRHQDLVASLRRAMMH